MTAIRTTDRRAALRAVLVVGAVLAAASCGGDGTSAVTTAPDAPATTGPTATGPSTATGPATFRDPVGDVAGGDGPDIVSVTVADTSADVTFAIRFAEAPPLRTSPSEGWIDMALVGIDVPPYGPPPGPIGGWPGVDYVAGLHGAQPDILFRRMEPPAEGGDQPTGTASATPDAPEQAVRLDATVDGATLRFAIPRRLLGDPPSFAFNVAAGREGETRGGGSDSAPSIGNFHHGIAG
jgi:hypothetical protein